MIVLVSVGTDDVEQSMPPPHVEALLPNSVQAERKQSESSVQASAPPRKPDVFLENRQLVRCGVELPQQRIPPPPVVTEFSVKVQSVSVGLEFVLRPMPPPNSAEFLSKLQSRNVGDVSKQKIAPPPCEPADVFPEKVQSLIRGIDESQKSIPPPLPSGKSLDVPVAELAENVQCDSTGADEYLQLSPPPRLAELPEKTQLVRVGQEPMRHSIPPPSESGIPSLSVNQQLLKVGDDSSQPTPAARKAELATKAQEVMVSSER
jgi:hypothetical protein